MAKFVYAYFNDAPGSAADKLAWTLMLERGGEAVGSGTDLLSGERDLQCRFEDDDSAEMARESLVAWGYRAEVHPAPERAN